MGDRDSHEEGLAAILSVTDVPVLSPLCVGQLSARSEPLNSEMDRGSAALPTQLLACEWCPYPYAHTRISVLQVPRRMHLSKVTCPRSRGEGQGTAERSEEVVRKGPGIGSGCGAVLGRMC